MEMIIYQAAGNILTAVAIRCTRPSLAARSHGGLGIPNTAVAMRVAVCGGAAVVETHLGS